MKINKQAFELLGITLEDYLTWCKDNKVPAYSSKTKTDFFRMVNIRQIVKDKKTGKLRTLNKNNKFILRG